jgi:prepilin-type N-terminal cleavage/methylation domain-containing protein
MKKNIRSANGFTLSEVMIVIAIISVLVVIGIPTVLNWLPNYRLKSATGDLSSNMQWTKLMAIRNNYEWGIQFNTGGDLYQIVDGGADGQCGTADDVLVRTISFASYGDVIQFGFGDAAAAVNGIDGNPMPATTVTFTNGLVWAGGQGVVFNGRGMANEAGEIYLQNSQNTAYGIGNNAGAYIYLRRWLGNIWE